MRAEKQKGPGSLAGGSPGGEKLRSHDDIARRGSGQDSFLPAKAIRPRHINLTPADRGRLHDFYVALHRVINAGRSDLAIHYARLAARFVAANGGAR